MKKKFRIKKNEEIEKIVKERNTVGDRFFVVYNSKNKYDHFRFALSVSKKFGKAHERNKVKRQVRSAVIQKRFIDKDIFIVIKPTVKELTYQEINNKIIKLLERANLIKEIEQ